MSVENGTQTRTREATIGAGPNPYLDDI